MAEAVGFFSEDMHAAHEINEPRFAHAILTNEGLVAQVGTDIADAR